jgi:hypothetical protein
MQRTETESTTTILQRLLSNIGAMLQTYALLAGEELRGTVRAIMKGVIAFAVAAVLSILALVMTVVTVVLALSTAMPSWLASLIVLAATLLAVGLLVWFGIRRFRGLRLRRLVTAFKEDVAWLRNELTPRS